jgi:hypothetical protein
MALREWRPARGDLLSHFVGHEKITLTQLTGRAFSQAMACRRVFRACSFKIEVRFVDRERCRTGASESSLRALQDQFDLSLSWRERS